jgi:dTDP-4-amino-4,6-dideoxygalactose transaminase
MKTYLPINPKLSSYNNIKKYLKKVDTNRYYSNFGPLYAYTKKKLKKFLNLDIKQDIVLTSSGHSSLLACMKLERVKTKKKYVIVPAFCFYSNPMSALDSNFELIFCDINLEDYTFDLNHLNEIFKKYKKQIAVINFISPLGFPVSIKKLNYIQKRYSTPVIYDAADTILNFKNIRESKILITTSFHPTKNFPANESGMIICPKKKAKELESIINFGYFGKKRTVKYIGFNGKFSEYDAAILLGNLEKISKIKKKLFLLNKIIYNLVKKNKNIKLLSNFGILWCSSKVLLFCNNKKFKINKFINDLKKKKIFIWRPWTSKPIFKEKKFKKFYIKKLPNAEILYKRLFSVPFSIDYKKSDFTYIFKEIDKNI